MEHPSIIPTQKSAITLSHTGETKIYIIIGLTSQCKTIYSEKNLPASLSQVNQRHDDRKHQV